MKLPIGDQWAFPDNECQSGMTYRQWLMGQVLQGSACSLYCEGGRPESIVEEAISIVDAALNALQQEAIANQQEVE